MTSPDGVGPIAWLLFATKAHQTPGTAGWLRALATTRTTIVILQNGVEHEERVRAYANGAPMLPAVVDCRAGKIGPGKIIQRTPTEIVVPATDAGRNFVALCEGTAMRVHTTTDLATVAWRKLCMNVAGGTITALIDRTLGVIRRPEPQEAGTSMLADRRLGLPLEVDGRNGAVVGIGARHRIATPLKKR